MKQIIMLQKIIMIQIQIKKRKKKLKNISQFLLIIHITIHYILQQMKKQD